MQLNRKLTGGLAWGGLFLVLAIPSADFVSRQLGGDDALLVTSEAPKAPAASIAGTTPADEGKPTRVAAVDPVSDFLSSGKKLPDYITGGGGDTAAAPAAPGVTPQPAAAPSPAVTSKPVVTPDGEIVTSPPVAATPKPETVVTPPPASQNVAIASEPLVAPVPMPAEMRPKPRVQPGYSSPPSAMTEAPVLIDRGPIVGNTDDALIRPPESIRTVPPEDVLLPPAEVGNNGQWEDEELAAYLEREGLIGTRGQRLRRDRFADDELFLDDEGYDEDGDSSVIFLGR